MIFLFWVFLKVQSVMTFFYYKGFVNGTCETIYGRLLRHRWIRGQVDAFLGKTFGGMADKINKHVMKPKD